ncbi:MAG: (Fe-S)-binding protein [Candidatus Helarchaeota archaeon]
MNRLKELESMVLCCMNCGDCRIAFRPAIERFKVCPIREIHPSAFEVYFARGKMNLAKGLLKGDLEPSKELAEIFYQCTSCGSCHEVCHQSQNPYIVNNVSKYLDHIKVWEAVRADLVDAGFAPLPRHEEIIKWMEKEHNPYMEKHEDRIKWLDGKALSEKAEVIFFMGCTEPYRIPEICKAIVGILEKAKIDFTIIHPEEYCCGSIGFRVGMRDLAEKLAKHNFEEFKKSGAKIIMTHCAGCYRTLKEDYKELFGELPYEVIHASQFILDLIKEGKLKLTKTVNKTVTYHDPCHLGRHTGIYEPPREILKSIPGIKLVEMERHHQHAWCCGAGGGVKSQFPDLANKIAEDRIEEANQTGAEILATMCPFCGTNLKQAIDSTKNIIQFKDVLELILEAIE